MLCPYCMKHNEWSSPRRKMLRAVARIVTKFWAWGVERPLLAYSYVVLESSICGYSAVDWDPLSICYMHGHGCIRNLHFVNCYYVRSVLSTCASYGTCCTRIYAPYTVSDRDSHSHIEVYSYLIRTYVIHLVHTTCRSVLGNPHIRCVDSPLQEMRITLAPVSSTCDRLFSSFLRCLAETASNSDRRIRCLLALVTYEGILKLDMSYA